MAGFWTILPGDAATTCPDPTTTTTQADLRFFADVAIPEVARMVEELGEAPVREGLRARLTESEAVARYGRLRDESAGLEHEARVIDAKLGRLRAEREEAVAVAAAGFARRLPDMDRQIADLRGKLAEATAAKKSITQLIADARHAANVEAARAAAALNRAVGTESHRQRLQILGRLSVAINPLLNELAGIEQIMALAEFKSLGGDVGAIVEEAARAATAKEQAASAAS